MSKNHLLFLLLSASIAALASAHIAQYIFDYQPCILCFYQRKPFFAIAALALVAIFLNSEKLKKITVILCGICLLINVGIATYHVGVEQKIFQGPSTCSAENLDEIQDLDKLKEAISKTKAIRCDEPQFLFLGLSMAAWNLIYCTFLLLIILFFRRLAIL